MGNKRILDVFRTYTDAYLEYVNNWISYDTWAEFYGFDQNERERLLSAVNLMKSQDFECRWTELDYYYHIANNNEYTEKTSKF
jgi:hypothetical protein